MNLHDLAALVEVRNHIPVLLNNKNLTTKGDFRLLVNAMNKLDQQFVEAVKALDYYNLFPQQVRYSLAKEPEVHTSGYIHVESAKDVMEGIQILSPANPNATIKIVTEDDDLKSSPSGVWEEDLESDAEIKQTAEDKDFKIFNSAIEPKYNHTMHNDAKTSDDDEVWIAERLKAQKEQLKKQGRSNKRVSKSKEDDAKK
jgi:hypothetical protein